jgi:hypothetical protein
VRANGVVLSSDRRFKQDIQALPHALDHLLALRGVTYTFRQAEFASRNFPAGRQIGVIAQELERVYPELVSTDAQGYKAVNYAQLTPVLIEAIKELQQQLEEQTRRATRAEAAATKAAAATDSFERRLRALEAISARTEVVRD